MAIVVKINGGNQDFEPLSEGVHPAVLADIVDLGMVNTGFGQKHKVRFVWVTEEKDSDGRQKYAFKRYTLSLHEKANLRKDVKGILGKDIDGEEFDIETLIGKYNNLVIQHGEDEKTGKVYANVVTLMKPTKRVAIPQDFVRAKDKDQSKKPAQSVKAAGGGTSVAAAILAPINSQPITDEDIPF